VKRLPVAALSVTLGVALCAAGDLLAQSRRSLQPEIRIDAFEQPYSSLGPGLGIVAPLGYYVRVGAGIGVDFPLEVPPTSNSWRADLLARALFDPFRQQRWALSIGGGLSFRKASTYVAAIADIEGPEVRGFLPAIQVGVSGGVRAGLILRRAVSGRR
jgi:hypothetical protein